MAPQFHDGEPYWVDVTSPNVTASAGFYERLFGWTTDDLGPESGHYTTLSLDGKQIGAISPLPKGGDPWWNVYFKVSDPHAITKAAEAAGANVIMPPMDVFDQSTIAVLQAPDGAIFGISQPKGHKGAELWDMANAPAGVSVLAEAPEAVEFYQSVFGWTTQPSKENDLLLTAAGADKPFGNMHVFGEERPEGVRPSWLVVFKTSDVDAVAAKATEMGCTIPVGPMDLPGVGRNAFVIDPNGAGFTIVAA